VTLKLRQNDKSDASQAQGVPGRGKNKCKNADLRMNVVGLKDTHDSKGVNKGVSCWRERLGLEVGHSTEYGVNYKHRRVAFKSFKEEE
jgi:hypothetical protein